MCNANTPIFIRKSFPKNDVYERYISHIDRIEWLTRITTEDNKYNYDLDIAYLLLPLIDTIASDILETTGRNYLKQLGFTKNEANVFYVMFRNGLMHNTHIRHIKYRDGDIGWVMSSGGGTGPWHPFDYGEKDEETGEWYFQPEKSFEYYMLKDGSHWAALSLDRLAMQIKADLEKRKESDQRSNIGIVVGEQIDAIRPPAELRVDE